MKAKLLLLVFALAAFFTLSSSTFAKEVKTGEPHLVSMKVNSEKKVVLLINKADGVKRLKYQFQIFDEKGETVYHQNFNSKEAIYLAFNLSEMPEGTYKYVVSYKYKPVYTKKVNLKVLPKQETKLDDILVELLPINE